MILLPFIYVFYYLLDLSKTESKVQKVEVASINPTLPSPFLDEDNLKDKFDAFQEAYKNNRKHSAIREIDRREENEWPGGQTLPEEPLPVYPSQPVVRKTAFNQPKRKDKLDSYETQMKLFKAQMQYVDSLIRVEEGSRETEDGSLKTEVRGQKLEVGSQAAEVGRQETEGRRQETEGRRQELEGRSAEQQMVKTKSELSGLFNTIAKQKNSQFIRAVIDEELKVTKSSRVRLRLLEDVKIGQLSLRKGQFLFGVVHAFKPQRVEIGIASILNNGNILDLSFEIYDLDGMKGLYIPESRYRELTKEVGENVTSSRQLPMETTGSQKMQLITELAKDAFNTTARTASKAMRRQKARLKYNTQVYLVLSNN